MRIDFTFNFRVIEGEAFEFSEVLAAPVVCPQETVPEEESLESLLTPVVPLGSSTIAPGLTVAVGV